jgi:putative heme iron utilization protein
MHHTQGMKQRGFHSADRDTLRECQDLIAALKTLHLATVNAAGEAEASYAPFVARDGFCFFLFLSDLAQHTANIRRSGRASVLLVEAEASAPNVFARRRGVFQCQAELIARDDSRWPGLLAVFEAKFGDIMDVLRSLQDFNLFRLKALEGSYVRGFGQAYRLGKDQM